MTKQNPFDAAIDLLKTERQIIARALDRTDSVEGQAYRQARFDQNEAAIRLLEAAGEVYKEIADVAIGQIRRSILVKDLKLGGKMRDGLEDVIDLLYALPDEVK